MRRILAWVLLPLLALSGLMLAPAQGALSWRVQCTFTDARFTEISGLARSQRFPGVLYLNNDSSNGPYVFAVDERTCRTLATLRVAGSQARDYEAIATGRDAQARPVIWLGDIGDNNDTWPWVEVLRIAEPTTLRSQTVSARRLRVTYPDMPHNAETLLANPTQPQLWIVTKQLAAGSLYALPVPPKAVNRAVPLRREDGLITDGSISPQGDRYVLRTYFDATVFTGLPPGKAGRPFDLPLQYQGEGITWTADGRALLVASERDNRLLRVEIPQTG